MGCDCIVKNGKVTFVCGQHLGWFKAALHEYRQKWFIAGYEYAWFERENEQPYPLRAYSKYISDEINGTYTEGQIGGQRYTDSTSNESDL